MTNYRYIQWNYDTNTATEYERMGDCSRCGACCKAIISFTAIRYPDLGPNVTLYDEVDDDGYPREDIRDGGYFVDGTGKWQEVVRKDGVRRFFKVTEIDASEKALSEHACSALINDSEGKPACSVHDTKSLLCSAWPMAPEHVAPFPECTYEFVPINEWQIDDDEGLLNLNQGYGDEG